MPLNEPFDISNPASIAADSLVNLEAIRGKNSLITGKHEGPVNITYNLSPHVPKTTQDDVYDNLMKALAVHTPREHLTKIKRVKPHAPGTCKWLVNSADYQQWRERDSPQILWLDGGPGMGKTILSTYLIQDLQESTPPGCKGGAAAEEERGPKPQRVAFYFCDSTDSRRNNLEGILGGLLRQLLEHQKAIFSRGRGVQLGEIESMFRKKDYDGLWTSFRDILNGISDKIYLIIDGLDECNPAHTKRFVELLGAEVRGNEIGTHVKILISSRPDECIQQHIESLAIRIKVNPGNVGDDVTRAIEHKLDKLNLDQTVGSDIRKRIEHALVEKSEGTFLWVDLVVENFIPNISSEQKLEDILEELGKLPRVLDEVYDKILARIYIKQPKQVEFVLPFVAIAKKPLLVDDIDMAFALWNDPSTLNPVPKVRILDVHKSCLPLVFHDEGSKTVSLIHSSAKDYLLSYRPQKLLGRLYYTCCFLFTLAGLIHQYFLFLSLLCLVYQVRRIPTRSLLSLSALSALTDSILQFENWKALVNGIRGHPYPLSTVRNLRIGSDQANFIALRVCLACLGNEQFDHGRKIVQREDGNRLIPVFIKPGLSESNCFIDYAAWFWQDHVLEMDPAVVVKYLRKIPDLAAIGTLRDMLLLSAARHGHDGVLRFLVNEVGARLNVVNWHGDTALHLAAFGGHLATVKLLLSYGLDLHTKNDIGAKPIHYAARSGSMETFQYLLTQRHHAKYLSERSSAITQHLASPFIWLSTHLGSSTPAPVDYEMPDSDGATLITWAIGGGSEEIVRFLLLHNVKTNYVYQAWFTRDFTLDNGLERLLGEVRDLISHKLEMTPLSLAASKGDQSIIELLLANGTDRKFEDTIGCTAVFWAAKRGHSSSLKILATDSTDCKKQLEIAIVRGEELAVANLIELGIVDLNKPGPIRLTPLALAACIGNETIMDSLLRLSIIQPDLKGPLGLTPLAFSALFDKHKMIRQLLNSGRVNVNSINDLDLTPVALAVAIGHQTAARTILEFKQVDMRQKDSLGRTITALAAVGGNKAIFDMLSQYGQPYTVADKLGRTPLFYAIKGGDHTIVQFILSHSRVSVVAKDAFGALPLSMAARFGDTASAALLLRESAVAQLRSKDMFGRSPLAWCAIEGHTSTRDFLLQKCRELSIRTGDETLPPTIRRMRRFKSIHGYCDICFLDLGRREPYYTCGKCFNGGFFICYECHTRLRPQPGCLQDFHRIFRHVPSGDWISARVR